MTEDSDRCIVYTVYSFVTDVDIEQTYWVNSTVNKDEYNPISSTAQPFLMAKLYFLYDYLFLLFRFICEKMKLNL